MTQPQFRKLPWLAALIGLVGLTGPLASAQEVAIQATGPATSAADVPVRIPGIEPPVTTFWQKLGIPQNFTRIRDGLLNRRGNLPFLERKPPVLKLADPRNLAKGKPEMIKAAAEIKQAEDMKKQKIKALKFLAGINCGCYNKDGKVEKAFLEALDDCDADVRKAAIEGLTKAAGGDGKRKCGGLKELCQKCKEGRSGDCQDGCQDGCQGCGGTGGCESGCAITCCTPKIQAKLEQIVYGQDENGCYKEPVAEIRSAAENLLLCICPCPNIKPEELVLPEPEIFRREELLIPPVDGPGTGPIGALPPRNPADGFSVAVNLSDAGQRNVYSATGPVGDASSSRSPATIPVPGELAGWSLSDQGAVRPVGDHQIENPERLVMTSAVAYRQSLGELLIEMPFLSELRVGWTVVVVDPEGRQALGRISESSGRRVLVTVDDPAAMQVLPGQAVRMGLIAR